jgi:nitroreductase
MIDLLRQRRSIRKYTNQKIEAEKIKVLKEALLRSPSSKNKNPWEFIFINDKTIINQLQTCKAHGTTPLITAPLAVVICADERITDVWVEDCSIASVLLQLSAQSLGLGSCWIQIRNRLHSNEISAERYIQNILEVPEYMKILSVVSIGYPVEWREGKDFEELQFEKIKVNSYS